MTASTNLITISLSLKLFAVSPFVSIDFTQLRTEKNMNALPLKGALIAKNYHFSLSAKIFMISLHIQAPPPPPLSHL